MTPEIVICNDAGDLSRKAAERFVLLAREAVKIKGLFTVVLAGGSTPRGLYSLLTEDPYRDKVPWERVHLFWGDERCVPSDHPESNYRMVHTLLLSKIDIPKENIHPMKTEGKDPEKAAEEYEQGLRRFFTATEDGSPRFDLVLLGIGADGHTASLFPGTPLLQERKRWVAAPYVEKLKAYRVTLTLPVFNNATNLVFLVSGKDKVAIFREVLKMDDETDRFPFQLVRPVRGNLLFFVDREAASVQ